MKIGVIGPKDSIEKVINVEKEYGGIEFVYYEAHTLKDSIGVAEKCQEETDGILFTGCGIYDHVSQMISLYKPNKFTPHNETSLFTLILNEKNIEIQNCSIDIIEENIVRDIVAESNLKKCSVLPRNPKFTEEDYIKFHDENWNSGDFDAVFTCFSAIYDYYKKREIPVYRLYTTKFAIRNTISQLISDIKNKQIDDSKISVQVIKIYVSENYRRTKLDDLDKVLDFEKELITYLRTINGAIFNFSWNEFIIFTTKGSIKSLEAKSMFHKIITKSKFRICSGVGIGNNASEAEYNAFEALKYSEENKENCLFFMNEDQVVEGPILEPNNLSYSSNTMNTNLEEISKITELSTNFLQKISSVIKLYGKDCFTSAELANYLGIGERSGRRILKKLVDGGYGSIVASKNKPGAGRPTNIIKITGL
ncbi:hypothetical protein [Fusibacter ferrireducens]|uniref:Transcriptional regulator n=1 Tax=Fusibacter ferrireducens TaxID=2785058 RepID=A0ABR9ZP22_9FIRM|nr:hypothetical protein [Fusibacter ferrireducens]MBF4692207.1 hypothetical protein [Fusibacter ferrireducens]